MAGLPHVIERFQSIRPLIQINEGVRHSMAAVLLADVKLAAACIGRPPAESSLRSGTTCATICSITRSRTSQGAIMNDSLPELGDLEREVMQLVWANGPVTAEAVREQLSRPLKESTVRTVLRRLEEKGYTTHTVDGRTYVYQAAEDRGRVAAKAVQRIVDWFCNGSVEEVLVGMVDRAMLDQKQLRALADQVARAKARGRKK